MARFILFLVVLVSVFSTWAMGGRGVWTPKGITVLSYLSLIPLLGYYFSKNAKRSSTRKKYGNGISKFHFIPFLGFIVFVLLSVYNASHEAIYQKNGLIEFTSIESVDFLPSTVDRTRSLFFLGDITGIALLCYTLCVLVQSRRQLRKLLVLICFNGAILCFIGIIFKLIQSKAVLGLFEVPNIHSFFATFRYHNHWSQYAFLMISSSAALGFYFLHKRSLLNDTGPKVILFFSISFFLTLSIFLSGSRSGLFFCSIYLLGTFCYLLRRKWKLSELQWYKKIPSIIAVLAVSFLLVIPLLSISEQSLDRSKDRTDKQVDDWEEHGKIVSRYHLTQDTAKMAMEREFRGWGLGSFIHVFPFYAGEELSDRKWEFAHNDWVQLWAELGIIGFVLLLGTPLSLILYAYRKGRNNVISSFLAASVFLLLCWAFVDLPFGNWAIWLHCVLLASIAGKYAVLMSDV